MADATIHPKVIVISGPNGAGKSTAAPQLLQGTLAVSEFVNADVIARGMSAFDPEKVAMQAGRVMLARLEALAKERASFAFEPTLASKTFAHCISGLHPTILFEGDICADWITSSSCTGRWRRRGECTTVSG